MGGNGAASGFKDDGTPYGKEYGSEYHTVYQSGNIKFVMKNDGLATAPLETRTKGRIYVTVNSQNQLKFITYYDKKNKKYKSIDLDHPHKINGVYEQPHRHTGYYHNEKGDKTLSPREQKMVDRVYKIWDNSQG